MALHLTDIIPLEDLQKLQDTLAEVAGVGAVIVDPHGKHITRPSRFSGFCALMRGNPETGTFCKASARELGETAHKLGRPVQKPCGNLGLADGAAPIILAGEHIASWMIGQCVISRLPEHDVRFFARANGFDEEELLAAYAAVPQVSPAVFSNALALMSYFTENLSQLCLKNYELQLANAEKARASATLETVLSNIDAAIYVCDPDTKELVFANAHLYKATGDPELIGKKCHMALHGLTERCSFCGNSFWDGLEGKPVRVPHRWEFRNPRNNRDYIVQDILMDWHDGRVLQLSMHIDVTERRALVASEAANAAKREFLAQMSHELRTPMNGVLGMTQLALRADPPPKQQEYLQKIQSSATLLLGVINDVLDFSKIEAGKIELLEQEFSLRDSLRTMREMMLPRTEEKGLALQLRINPAIPDRLYGDSLRFSQVLMNLLSNAVKFTKEGFVRISLDMRDEPDEDRIRLFCSVSDSGMGMTPEQSAKLFTPFVQADSSISKHFGGTGLGLAISKKLVELMGGSIHVASEPGKGSTFSFDLPMTRLEEPARRGSALPVTLFAPPDASAPYSDADMRNLLAGKKILVAEDNEINQEIALELLRTFGAEPDLAANGQEAVDAAAATPYDMILMDIQMPVMDGYEATQRIRTQGSKNGRAVPIIAMTASAMNEDREKTRAAGMNGHIAKPIDMDELCRVLRALV